MKTPDRRDRARELCIRLTQDVAEIATQGIGYWDHTWDLVGDADAQFMAALSAWESDPTPEALATVTAAYDAVLTAWKGAVDQDYNTVILLDNVVEQPAGTSVPELNIILGLRVPSTTP